MAPTPLNRTSGQLPEPASGVGHCSTADEVRAEPHAPTTSGLLIIRPQPQRRPPVPNPIHHIPSSILQRSPSATNSSERARAKEYA
jgi:hypothetical protein